MALSDERLRKLCARMVDEFVGCPDNECGCCAEIEKDIYRDARLIATEAAEEMREENQRLSDMIVAFARHHAWAADVWKRQEHIAPLFAEAERKENEVSDG